MKEGTEALKDIGFQLRTIFCILKRNVSYNRCVSVLIVSVFEIIRVEARSLLQLLAGI